MSTKTIFRFATGLSLVVAILSGCASSQSAPDMDPGQIPTIYDKIDASLTARPDWIDITPDDENDLHFLVGLSEHHASERAAREDAMRHARTEYANYTGVDVSIVDEIISTLYGKSSDIFDATVAQRTKSTETAEAQVSRIKAKQWYWEKYKATYNKKSRGQVYKYWVLVTIPVDEYDHVQQVLLDQVAAAENGLQNNLQRTEATLAKARKAMSSGDVIQALNLIQQEWNLLYSEIKRFEAGDKYYKARVGQLQIAQKKLGAEIGTIRSSLIIDTCRGGSQIICNTGQGGKVTAWV
ncbi:MAG: hypothetical protein KKB30_12935, partial [Proteobacteria bacterium]|nr:hypothetical protein [Pseudomonadota bacterium]